MKDNFSTFDIVKALDIPRERLRAWMKLSLIQPTIAAGGKGKKAVFTRQDVYWLELFRQLVEHGFGRNIAHLIVIESLKRMNKEKERNVYLIIRLGKIMYSRRHAEIDKHFREKLTPEDEQKLRLAESKDEQSYSFAGDDDIFSLITGSTETEAVILDNNWRFIHIINLRTLQRETDKALEKL